MKAVLFVGSALDDLRQFPAGARRDAGYQLDRVQNNLEPSDWKPMSGIGSGVQEIRIRDLSGAFRIIYVARFVEAVYVLHCFQKKSQKTAQRDLELAARRYEQLMKERKA
jgi:phage-related protein